MYMCIFASDFDKTNLNNFFDQNYFVMSVYHDEVEIEDFELDSDSEMFYYPCPCGDRFEISKVRLLIV